jgi:hypothetical protein
MRNSSLIGALTIMASAHYDAPDYVLNPEPWARGSSYKGSGTGTTGLNVAKSRAKAKSARKARRKARKC